MISTWKKAVHELKSQTIALYFAYQDPRIAWYAKVWIALVIAYAFSPIDLIPDFIPILGYLDDLVILPLGIWLAVRMIPAQVMQDSRARADRAQIGEPQFRWMIGVVVLIWTGVLVWVVWTVWKIYANDPF